MSLRSTVLIVKYYKEDRRLQNGVIEIILNQILHLDVINKIRSHYLGDMHVDENILLY
jgi:hypothetical protein